MTMLSNAFFKPSVQTQSVSALEMAPAVQQLMGRYHLLYKGLQVQSSASHVCMMTLVVVVFLTLCRHIISSVMLSIIFLQFFVNMSCSKNSVIQFPLILQHRRKNLNWL